MERQAATMIWHKRLTVQINGAQSLTNPRLRTPMFRKFKRLPAPEFSLWVLSSSDVSLYFFTAFFLYRSSAFKNFTELLQRTKKIQTNPPEQMHVHVRLRVE